MKGLAKRLRLEPGQRPGLARRDPHASFGARDKRTAATQVALRLRRLNVLQERLYAERAARCWWCCRAWTPAGKDGIIRHVMTGLNPQGCRVTSFKVPTRGGAGARLPVAHPPARRRRRGEIGIFNRSHYEDVLVVRVHDLVPQERLVASATSRSTSSSAC